MMPKCRKVVKDKQKDILNIIKTQTERETKLKWYYE